MKKWKTYTMKEANAAGISRLVRESEDDLIVLRRNGVDVGLLLPLTMRGVERLIATISEAMFNSPKMKENPDVAAALRSVFKSLDEAIAEKNRTEGSAMLESNTSAVPMGDKSRRRKSPALPK